MPNPRARSPGRRKLRKLSLKLVSPGCLLGPAQLVRRSPAVALHRALLLRAMPALPRWQWFALLVAGVLRWYLVEFWKQLDRALNIVDAKVVDTGKSRSEQVRALFHLGLHLGAQPAEYFGMRLYRFERSRWLHFVFPQEQQTWHPVHTHPGRAAAAVALLRDKHGLENGARALGLRTARTLASFRAGAAPALDALPDGDIFLKPNAASGACGGMALERDAEGGLRLRGYSLRRRPVDETEPEAIEAALREAFEEEDYLAQELLRMSAEFARFCGTSEFVTVRVVTARIGRRTEMANAALEAPGDISAIDADGRVRRHAGMPPELPAPAYCDSDESVPSWPELLAMARRAHDLVPDMRTVAWDLTVATQGPTLLEGNHGWGMVVPQRTTGVPMLETPALDAWSARRG